MKKITLALGLGLLAFALAASAQTTTPTPAPAPAPALITWTVSGIGCPAAIDASLSAQWTAAATAAAADPGEAALESAEKTLYTEKLASINASAPHTPVAIRIGRNTPGNPLVFSIVSIKSFAGSGC